MTIPLLWPPDYPVVSELPVGRLKLTGHKPESSATESVVFTISGTGEASPRTPLVSILAHGALRLRAGKIQTTRTDNRRAALPLGTNRFRSFLPTAQVRYSEARQVEEEEALAVFCSLLQ